jgi:hypothetical protein
VRRIACACPLWLLVACSGTGVSTQRDFPRIPPEAAGAAIHAIHPGVLRGLMMDGELTVTPDAETLAAMAAAEARVVEAMVSICLDVEGMATLSLAARSRYPAFNDAVIAAVGGWRFRPYVRDGAAAEACSTAVFRHDTAAAQQEPALPAPAVELPAPDLGVWAFPHDTVDVPATPGVALAQVCRRVRRRQPPDVTFLQSSGDAATDRALLDEREVMFAGEDSPSGTICRIRSMLKHVPEPAELRKKPAISVEVEADVLATVRVSGEKNIAPADTIKNEIRADRVTELKVPVKLCIDRTGRITDVEMIGSTGYMAYDADLINAVAAWRYGPYIVNDAPVRACTLVHFVYRQR